MTIMNTEEIIEHCSGHEMTLNRLAELCGFFTLAGEYSSGCTNPENHTCSDGAAGNCHASGCPIAGDMSDDDSDIMDGDRVMSLY